MSKQKTGFKEQFQALKNLPRFLRMVWDTHKGMTAGNVFLRIIKSVIPLLMLYVGKEIIDEVIGLMPGGSGGDMQYLWLMVGLELGLAVISDIINRWITLLDSLLGDLFANHTSVLLIQHAASLDLYQFEDADFYDKLERARRQTVGRTILMSQVLAQFQDLITILFLSIGLIAFSPWLILLLIVAVIPSFLGESHFNHRSYSLTRNWTPQRRELDYLRYIGASDVTAKEVKIFNLADFLANRFKSVSDEYYEANRKLAIKRYLWGVSLSALGTLSYYGAYVFIVLQTVSGAITVGTLTFLAGSFSKMRSMLQAMMKRFTQIADGALYLQDLFDFLEIVPNIKSPNNPVTIPQPIQRGFTFENVGFKYPGSEKWALRGVSFHLNAGEKMALVGENGAGKTTLVKLLARLYEPSEGRILLDGVDLRQYGLKELRTAIGIIFQDYVRFQMKAMENIAVGQIDEVANMELIEGAAQKSLAHPVVEELPEQYDQILGKRFANGVELSGGQWQKVALARAYMRNAQLLILDEPTAALDARAEHEVFQRFADLIQGKSAVLISHRFSTVRMADRILFLEKGRRKELGSHDELLAQGGQYAELFHLQAQGYM